MSFPFRSTCMLRESEFSRCCEREKCRQVKVVEGMTVYLGRSRTIRKIPGTDWRRGRLGEDL
jgi:hypothetical protein